MSLKRRPTRRSVEKAKRAIHQGRNAGFVARRRRLAGRTPDKVQTLQVIQGLVHRLSRRVRRREALGDSSLQFFVGQRRAAPGLGGHMLGDGQIA